MTGIMRVSSPLLGLRKVLILGKLKLKNYEKIIIYFYDWVIRSLVSTCGSNL